MGLILNCQIGFHKIQNFSASWQLILRSKSNKFKILKLSSLHTKEQRETKWTNRLILEESHLTSQWTCALQRATCLQRPTKHPRICLDSTLSCSNSQEGTIWTTQRLISPRSIQTCPQLVLGSMTTNRNTLKRGFSVSRCPNISFNLKKVITSCSKKMRVWEVESRA